MTTSVDTRSAILANSTSVLVRPIRATSSFLTFSVEVLAQAVRPPFAWREFLVQVWFVARVTVVPATLLTIPFSVITALHLNVLLTDIGAADLSGAGVGWATTTGTGPIATVFVVAGAAATAICADLGARTIREEIDAMRVMGINPVEALLVPRVAALTICATLLNGIVCVVGIASGYLFAVYVQHVNPGSFSESITLITGLGETIMSFVKACLFGLAAGLIACYKGTTVAGGAQGVGNAVNETVVFSFMALMFILLLTYVFSVQL